MKSVWSDTVLPQFPQLQGDQKTDVLIIGGGIAGLLTAYFLHQHGVNYILVEKGRICGRNTQNTTAKLTAQHGLIYSKLLKNGGEWMAKQYLAVNTAALQKFAALCTKIECDYEKKDNFVYSSNKRHLEKELEALQKIGANATFQTQLPLPVAAAGAVKFPEQAQFHPLKLIAGISDKRSIFENTFVREMIGNTAVTDNGRIAAEKVICTTHFPFINKHGGYFLKLYQHRSYVIALENAPNLDGMYVDENDAGLSFRNYRGLLLLGGGGSRTGKKNGNWAQLRAFAHEHYPQATETAFWAAQDCMSLDRIPYIGQYSKHTPNLYVATGYNKWGMTGAMVSAMILCDQMLGKQNDYADLFQPSRSILKPQLFVNGFESVANLLMPSKHICPHLGCALKWNAAEHSWDCPCHGSRFSENGDLLENPANGDLRNI